MKQLYKNILAKTYTKGDEILSGVCVHLHCIIVGIVCEEIVKTLPIEMVEEYNLTKYPLYAALHDIGKASPGFHHMLNLYMGVSSKFKDVKDIEKEYIVKHEHVSAEWLLNNKEEFSVAECVIAPIRWHHGSRRADDRWTDQHRRFGNNSDDIKWDDVREEIFNSLCIIFKNSEDFINTWRSFKLGDEAHSILTPQVKYLMGLLCVSDWIGSDESVFNPDFLKEDVIDLDFIRNKAKQAIEAYGLNKIKVFSDMSFGDIWANYEPNDIQRKLADIVEARGVYIVEAPTGTGKTEAAEYAAYVAMQKGLVNGIYFALPTQTTSNSLFDRYRTFIEKICECREGDIRLMHSKAIYHNTSNSGMHSWFTGKRSILSQFGLGTLDQALISVLGNIRHFFVRSFGLANKCVIIDEVHTYDAYTKSLSIELIDQLVQLNSIVIILSATLTSSARNSIIGCGVDDIKKYPLITAKNGNEITYIGFNNNVEEKSVEIKQIYVENGTKTAIQHKSFISSREKELENCINKVNSGQMVLWIENTVDEAIAVFEYFEHRVKSGILHSRFTTLDRQFNENKWIGLFGKNNNIRTGCVLVSTQVCEQSIDIDADYLVTAICPTDMLVQRIGRLFRHTRECRQYSPECTILTHNNYDNEYEYDYDVENFRRSTGPSNYVYHPYFIRRSQKILKGLTRINIPSDIRTLLEETYNDNNISGFDLKLLIDSNKESDKMKQAANNSMLNSLGHCREESIIHGTRYITEDNTDVLLISNINGNNITTIYGENVKLTSNMSTNDMKKINNSIVRINQNIIEKNDQIFFEIQPGKIKYCVGLIRNGLLVNNHNNQLSNMTYSSEKGFKR